MSENKRVYNTRQRSYLQVGALQLLQMILYLDDEHVNWMNDSILEAVLGALKMNLIPKIKEGQQKKSQKGGSKSERVDVYRGANFQMAFFFRATTKGHAVLVKDKYLIYPTQEKDKDQEVEIQEGDERPTKRPRRDSPQVKEEAVEIDIQDVADKEETSRVEEEAENTDEKPQIKVNYRGYNIYAKDLIVIVEPYPPLSEAERMSFRRTAPPTEIRQLTMTAEPEVFKRPAARERPLFRATTSPIKKEEESAVRNALGRLDSVDVTGNSDNDE